jgi:ribose 5-phosphate isomerase A
VTESTSLKQQAADHAVSYVQSGMVVGLGTGSTAILFVRRLAERLAAGELRNIVGVPTSRGIEEEARKLGIPIALLEDQPLIDLTVDGADEVDPALNLIKGGGGALLREKLVAQASQREIIIVDESKLSPLLGTTWHVPIEVIPFGWRSQALFLETLGAKVTVRQKTVGQKSLGQHEDAPFMTDQGNLILDSHFGPIPEPAALAAKIKARTGIVDHGLFVGLTSEVIVAGVGGIRVLKSVGQ